MNRSALSLLILLALACGDDDAPADAGPGDSGADVAPDAQEDAGPDAMTACDMPVAFPPGDAPAPVTLGGEGAVAGSLGEAQLPIDPTGLGEWASGDFVLANENVAMILTAADHASQTYDPYGGRVVGITAVDGDQLVDAADFGLMVLSLGRFLLATESVSILNDGSDGEAAVIRTSGPLAELQALGDLIAVLAMTDFAGSQAAIDYSLAPGAFEVEVTLRVMPPRPLASPLGGLQVFFQNNRMPVWRPITGFGDASDGVPYLAFSADRTVNFAWLAPEESSLMPIISLSGADVFSSGRVVLACGETAIELGRIAVGSDTGLPSVQAVVGGATLAEVSGIVQDTDGTPLTDVRIHAVTAGGEHLSRFVPADDGRFSEQLDDRAAELFVWRAGFDLAGPFPAGTDVTLELPTAETLDIVVTEEGEPSPAKVEIFRADDTVPTAPESFGESSPGSGRILLAHPSDGMITAQLPAGDYRVRVGRGPTYERVEMVLSVPDTAVFNAPITEILPNPGVLCGDFHIHTHRSVDSSDDAEDKIRAFVAEGVHLAIRTEHEYVADFGPVVEALGLQDYAAGFSGLELTTVEYGHFNTFPLTPRPNLPGAGAPLWPGKLPSELFDDVRNRDESPTLIINHPRDGGALQAYFNAVGFDPVLGTVENPELWDEEFQVVEVFNDSNFEGNREGTVTDWFALLNQGRRIAAVGSSDSHRFNSVPLGYPRTCLQLGTNTPSEVAGTDIQAALEAGNSVIYGGIDLRVAGPGGEGPGDTVEGMDEVIFDVRLAGAEHVEINRLEVIVDGETVDMIPVEDVGAGVRFDETISVPVAAGGSWVVFHAAGDAAFNANGSRPFAVSNPIFMTP